MRNFQMPHFHMPHVHMPHLHMPHFHMRHMGARSSAAPRDQPDGWWSLWGMMGIIVAGVLALAALFAVLTGVPYLDMMLN